MNFELQGYLLYMVLKSLKIKPCLYVLLDYFERRSGCKIIKQNVPGVSDF